LEWGKLIVRVILFMLYCYFVYVIFCLRRVILFMFTNMTCNIYQYDMIFGMGFFSYILFMLYLYLLLFY